MSDTEGLQQCLAAMGFAELGLALVALCCYSLVLTGPFGLTGRSVCAATALVCAAAFSALTDPWVYGVILTVIAIVGMGLFGLAVWAISALCGVGNEVGRAPGPSSFPEEAAIDGAAVSPAVRLRPGAPMHSA